MPKAQTVTGEASTEPNGETEDFPPSTAAVMRSRKPKRKTKLKQKITPLPFRQLVPMTFVLLNESLCNTMLMPFIGFLVAYLENCDPDDAGFYSGLLQGVFSVGQIVSARFWGQTSDRYGRRMPLISGLFSSGVTMLCFGLSDRLWLCALFRFIQGLFNGNVLVAKTMMADITDKTNQAQGFAFVSFVGSIGLLIGPLLGGLLYDPTAEDSSLHFLGFDPNGIFHTRPALLPSLIMFVYSMVGMTACTFFVQESNPLAGPIPCMYRFVFPCLFVPAKKFEPTPMAEPVEVTDSDAGESGDEDEENEDPKCEDQRQKHTERSGELGVLTIDSEVHRAGDEVETDGDTDEDEALEDPRDEVSATFPVATVGFGSPVALEDTRRFDELMEALYVRRQQCSSNYSPSSSGASFGVGGGSVCSVLSTESVSGRHGHKHHRRHRHEGGRRRTREGDVEDEGVDGPLSLQSLTGQEVCTSRESFDRQVSASSATENPSTKPGAVAGHGELSKWETDGGNSSLDASVMIEKEFNDSKNQTSAPNVAGPIVSTAQKEDQQASKESESAIDDDDTSAEDHPVKKRKGFGYREAFTIPITRFLLVTYMIVIASDLAIKQCFPLWAITSVDKGGLGFSTAQLSYVLLFNALPTLVSNYFFAIACRRYANKIGLFRVGIIAGLIFGVWTPTTSYVPINVLKYAMVVLCSSGQQFFSTWCYGLITMLTARAAPVGQVGALLGINQSAGAAARAVTPMIVSPIYAVSIQGNHHWPFNHVFVFYLASLSFTFCWFRSYGIKTINDTELVLETSEDRFGPAWLRAAIQTIRRTCGCTSDSESRQERGRQEASDVVIHD